MDGPKIRFTVQGGASFVRSFPTMPAAAALAYASGGFGLRSILRRAGHFKSGGAYEWLDTFPACKVELL